MKVIVFLIAFAAVVQSYASILSCEDTVRVAIAQKLSEEPKYGSSKIGSVTLEKVYDELAIYKVVCGTPVDQIGIPLVSSWLVITREGPMATCTVESVILDSEVQ